MNTSVHSDVIITTEVPAELSAGVTPEQEILDRLKSLALDKTSILERQRMANHAQYIAGQLALKGQITVFFAGPNTGKTLLCLRLLADAYKEGFVTEDVYHINLDDDYNGATVKGALGLDNGFRVITAETFTHPLQNFKELIELLVKSGAAKKTIFVLDTVKKFADVMDKKAMSAFVTECRKLTSAGGSIIALAHTNKITNDEAKVIPGGTSDLLDDCDCAYVLSISNEEKIEQGLRRYVTFEQHKSRGPTVREALYSYEVNDDGDYNRLFNSVQNESPESIKRAQCFSQAQKEQSENGIVIEAITSTLCQGEVSQTALIKTVQETTPASRNQVLTCLEKWASPQEEGGLWTVRKGDKNANLYQLY